MAIRSGTGGLKYPLPANTDVQQSIAAASSGGSAAASAYGANRQFAANKMRVQADLANAAADRDFRARSQMAEQGFRAQQEFYDREHAKGAQLEAQRFDAERQAAMFGQQTALQQAGQQFSADQDILQQTYQSDRDLRQIQAQQVAGLPEIPENARGQTRQHLQRLRGALQELVGQNWNPNDPATRDTFNQTLSDYNNIVQSIPKPNPVEKFQQNTFEVNGTRYQEGPKGQYVEVPNSAQAEAANAQKQSAEAQQSRQDAVSDRADKIQSLNVETTRQEALQKADELLKTDEAFFAQQQSAVQQPEQAPAAPIDPAKAPVPLPPGHPNAAPPPGQPAPQSGQPPIVNATLGSGSIMDINRPQPGQPDAPPTGAQKPVTPQGPPAYQKPDGTYGAAAISPDAFNQQWAKLPPGASMVGPDGKTYFKK